VRSCLAKPGTEAVHRLRTTSRRVEAQLTLLAMLPGLPPHEREQHEALHLLKRLLRAAGRVRDIDVQRELIRVEALAGGDATPADSSLRSEARHLRRHLKRQRDEEAKDLLHLLQLQHEQLHLAFAALLNALAPARSLSLSEAELIKLVRTWYGNEVAFSDHAKENIAELHAMRKRAKLARYLAESAPATAVAARRLAARYESLQQAGGDWHDRIVLAEIAAEELGRNAKLAQLFAAQADRVLRVFKRRLRYRI